MPNSNTLQPKRTRINEVRLFDFKNFHDATLAVGPFTVIIGANAAGKSNVRDAFRFLHGIGRGYTVAGIIGGRYGAGGQSEWAQLRGAAREIVRFGSEDFEFKVKLWIRERPSRYEIKVRKTESGRSGFRVISDDVTP